MIYDQTKFVCKGITGSEAIAEAVIFWLNGPSLWSWLADSNPLFLNDTPAYDDVINNYL